MLRRRLHKARDMAGRRAWQLDQTASARHLYHFADEAAGIWVYAPSTVDELNEILRGITHLFRAASIFNRLDRSDD